MIVHAAYAQDPRNCLLANDRQDLQKSHAVDCCDRQAPSIAIVKALGKINGRASQRSRRVTIINCAYKVFFWPCLPLSANAGKGPADLRPLSRAGVQGRAEQDSRQSTPAHPSIRLVVHRFSSSTPARILLIHIPANWIPTTPLLHRHIPPYPLSHLPLPIQAICIADHARTLCPGSVSFLRLVKGPRWDQALQTLASSVRHTTRSVTVQIIETISTRTDALRVDRYTASPGFLCPSSTVGFSGVRTPTRQFRAFRQKSTFCRPMT